ncbi:MAG TPA: PINc/VapC family ATPase [Candidatus Thermoplasmatota archaeon]|nr:PINc/VapC family ATPase [Candidatus Thermoplasmatota archaeon]
MPPAKKPASKPAKKPPTVIVPDTSVLVDGRLTQRIQDGDLSGARILIPLAAMAELEFQANQGRESGFAGLDEVVKVQELKETADLDVEFVGERPTVEDIELAGAGEIDARIREIAVKHRATLLTSDRVQAHVARAMGLDVEWIRPITQPREIEADISSLRISQFFDQQTMSVHLKQDVVPLAKKGTPGNRKLVRLSEKPLELRELTRMRREIIEAAKRDAHSFIEIERHGATVVQLGNMRIAIAQPPFSDAVEITAVRPVARKSLDDYALPQELRDRLAQYERGVFVSGPPGSGKSTFVTAVAQWLAAKDVIVKTMESPRDLQVGDEITQYAPLEKDMELTSDVLLLVRPDYVIYDEVRKTEDFEIFADMRLAGVGLVGVTHANRAIDAVQRLIGRVELGMIPQVVDTVVHIMDGRVQQVLEMRFTVKVPAGMVEADLARPVIEVRDFTTKRAEYEIYTYGEQVVVMPLAETQGQARKSGVQRLAADSLRDRLRRHIDAPFEVEVAGENAATVFVPEREIAMLVGKGGSNVKHLEQVVGLKLDIRPMRTSAGWQPRAGTPKEFGTRSDRGRFDPARPLRRELGDAPGEADDEEGEADAPRGREPRYAEITPELRKSKKNVVLLVDRGFAGQRAEVVAGEEALLTATVSHKGEVRIARHTPEGELVMDALAKGEVIRLRV